MHRVRPTVVVLLLLAGCSGGRDDQPGGITADQDRQLNDAAAMLDANSVDANAGTPDTNGFESTP